MPRSLEIRQLRSKLRRHHFVGITGPLKSGKTRLCSRLQKSLEMEVKDFKEIEQKFNARAGMKWKVVNVGLTREDNPYDQLTREIVRPDRSVIFSSKDKISPLEERRIKTLLIRPGNEGLIQLYKDTQYIQNYNLLIIIDQFENLFFTTKIKQREKADFIQLLLNASYNSGTIYVATAFRPPRDERWRDKYRDLSEALIHCEFPLFHLKQKDLEKAISTFFQERSMQMEKKRNPNLLFVQPHVLKEEKHQELVQELFYEPEPFKVLEKTVTDEFIENHGIPPENSFDSPYSSGEEDDDGIEFYFGEEKEAKSDLAKMAEKIYLNLASTLKKRVAQKLFLYLADQKPGEDGVPPVKHLGEVINGIGRYDVMVPEIVSIFGEESVIKLNDAGPTDPKLEIQIPDPFLFEDWVRLREWIEESGKSISTSGLNRESVASAMHGPVSAGIQIGSSFDASTISDPLAREAEETFQALDSQLLKRAAEKIFVQLAQLPADKEAGLPGTISKKELFSKIGRFLPLLPGALNAFVAESIISPAAGDKVRIADGVLFDAWPRMVKWTNDNGIRPDIPVPKAGTPSTRSTPPPPPIFKEKPLPKRQEISRSNVASARTPKKEKPVARERQALSSAPARTAPKVAAGLANSNSDAAKNAEAFYGSLKGSIEKRIIRKILVAISEETTGLNKDEIMSKSISFHDQIPRMLLQLAASGLVEAKNGSVNSGAKITIADANLTRDWDRLRRWMKEGMN